MAGALAEGLLALATFNGLLPPSIGGPLAKVMVVLLVSYGLWQNANLRSLWFVWLGLALNSVVIVANGGHMPVSLAAAESAGFTGLKEQLAGAKDAVHSLLIQANTPFWFLGDVIPVSVRPLRNVISLGDVMLMLGIAGFFVEAGLKAGERQLAFGPRLKKWLLAGLFVMALLLWTLVLRS